jgi:hypothetical protein
MKAWQKIIGLVLTTVLVLTFYVGHVVYKLAKKISEGFQASGGGGASGGSAPATNNDPSNPGEETQAEKEAFDLFEYMNQSVFQQIPTTPVEAYDPSTALAQFDEEAPAPWDFDNKLENPKDILWGYVDSRCSLELWTAARTRAIFNTANNIEISDRGGISYYSNILGTLFHDPGQIAMVKVGEFFLDFAVEEIIEGSFERIKKNVFDENMEAWGKATQAAKDVQKAEIAAAKAAGKTVDRAALKKTYTAAYTSAYDTAIKEIGAREAKAFGAGVGRLKNKVMIFSRAAEAVKDKLFDAIEAGLRGIGRGTAVVGRLARSTATRAVNSRVSQAAGKMFIRRVGGSQLGKLGQKAAQKVLAKLAGMRAISLFAAVGRMMGGAAAFFAIPIVGQIIGWAMFALSLFFLAIVPQVLSILADLDEDASASGAQRSVQGCPPDQPFNIIAAMEDAMGSTAKEIVLAVPVIGDGIAAFGPYLCSSNDLSSTSFRQSFRAPPYYFDTTLSLYYTEKPKMLDGGYNGTVKADPMYTDPSKFKLRMTPDEYLATHGVTGDPDTLPFWSETVAPGQAAAKYYHPWIDYAHKEILDKMAAFYYDMAKRNQQYDFDGNASFEYISRFMGVIASSQLSCDVQVKLKKVTFNPVANVKLSEEDVPDPDTAAQEEMGCTFHDRRFYFTVDYTKCSAFANLTDAQKQDPTIPVLEYLLYAQPTTRLSEYRKMFVVIGCTNTNGTAPAVIDRSFGNGDFVGEAPVGLGPIGGEPVGYKPPILKTSIRDHADLKLPGQQDIIEILPNDTTCNAVSSVVTSFSVTRQDSSPQDRTPSTTVSSSIPDIVVTAPDSYIGPGGTQQPTFSPIGVTEKTPTTDRGSASTFADISRVVPNPTQGNLIYVASEGRKYIFWAGQWQRYSPMPVWSAEGGDALNRFYLTNTTKYWRFTKINPSDKQKIYQGMWGGLMGSLPLFFGFEGGAVATALDVGGVNSKVACAYSDVMKQTGTYAINGFIVTSENHFILNKGPLIQFAPGYEPSFEAQKCKSIPITQKVCANRYMIRSLNKKFMKEVPGRRIKVISGIVPSPSDKTCIYFTQNVQINADKTDIEGSENLNAIVAKPVIGDTSTCSFQWAAEPLLVAGPDYEYAPIPFDSTMFAQPLTPEEFAALPNDPRLANGRRTFQRKNCSAANYGDCSKELIRTKLMNDFNAEYMKVDGNPTLGYYTRITSIQDWRTPDTIQRADPNYPNVVLQPKVMSPDPVCVYKATVETETVSGVKTMNNVIIKMLLDESTDDTCLYTIKSHDFPRKMFTTPVPSSGVLELPSLIAFNKNENFLRAGCSDEYKDCSNPAIINRLMNQFNQRNRTTKILQVVRANTPIVPGDSAAFCDFEADVFGSVDDSAFLERQSLRFKLTPTPPSDKDPELKCLYDINFDWTDFKRGTGKSILKNTDDQVLKSPYYWPVNYVTYIRKNLNTLFGSFRGLQIPETLQVASKDMRDKLGTLQNRLKSAEEIVGCISNNPDSTKLFTCKNPLFLRAFIRRYNFDNWPKYPKSQFGSTKRSIIDVQLAGSAGGTECHVQLIEREETFVNFLKEPMIVETANLAEITDTALLKGDSNKKNFLRQYRFNVGGPPRLVGGNCLFTLAPYTEDDIKNRTFDIPNNQEAYGINMEPTTPVQITGTTKTDLADDLAGTRGIYPWNTLMLNVIRDAVNGYKDPNYGKADFVRMELERLYVAVNVQPNILEFGAEVKETYNDPDFGFIGYRGEKVILTAYWDDWDPVAAVFPGGTVPKPNRFTVMNIMRSEIVDKVKLKSDRTVMEFAPYLYFTTTDQATRNFYLDYNPKTEKTRLVYPAGTTSYITPDSTDRTKWKLYADASSSPADFRDTSPPRLYVTL